MVLQASRLLILGLMAIGLLVAMPASDAAAAGAMIRVVHASPDAPAVDVYLNGQQAITNLKFGETTQYAMVPAASYRVQVFATGTGPSGRAVIDAQNVALADDKVYTVVAANRLANIEPLVLTDDLTAPAAGKAHVRVVHASTDAPAVDVAVAGGPVVFRNAAFKQATPYTPVDAGSYRFEVRPTGTTTAVITTDSTPLTAGRIYTFYAIGLVGNQTLQVAASVDNAQSGGVGGTPATGGGGMSASQTGGIGSLALAGSLLGLLVVGRRFAKAGARA